MTKAEAIHEFMSGFNLQAFDAFSVPSGEDAPEMPYLTYDLTINDFDGGEAPIQVNLWYRTTSNAEPNAKAQELYDAIDPSQGVTLSCDDGIIRLYRGSPWCQSLEDPNDASIKRRHINVAAKYYTI